MKVIIKVYLYDSKTGKQISGELAKKVEKTILVDFQNELGRIQSKVTELGYKALGKIQLEEKNEH